MSSTGLAHVAAAAAAATPAKARRLTGIAGPVAYSETVVASRPGAADLNIDRPGKTTAKSVRFCGILPPHLVATSGKAITDTPPIQSLDRGLAILEAVAASSHPVPLKQLTDLIGIDRSSVFRLANTLRQRRFLANPKGSKDYILGPTAWRLSRRYGRNVLGMFFHHQLQELTATLGETSHFTVREGIEAFFIYHQIPTGQVVSVAGQTGEFAPLHCTAHG